MGLDLEDFDAHLERGPGFPTQKPGSQIASGDVREALAELLGHAAIQTAARRAEALSVRRTPPAELFDK